VRCFHDVPAEVLSTGNNLGGGDVVDLFPCDLTNVGDVHVTGCRVEIELPGIAKTRGEYFRSGRRVVAPVLCRCFGNAGFLDAARGIRIRFRNAVGVWSFVVDVEAKDVPEQVVYRLRSIVRIAGEATIANGKVEIPVRTEEHGAAVVINVWIIDGEEHFRAFRIGDIRVVGGDAVLRQEVVTIRLVVTVVDKEAAVGFVIGMEGEAQ
jgi:hypothetical protein